MYDLCNVVVTLNISNFMLLQVYLHSCTFNVCSFELWTLKFSAYTMSLKGSALYALNTLSSSLRHSCTPQVYQLWEWHWVRVSEYRQSDTPKFLMLHSWYGYCHITTLSRGSMSGSFSHWDPATTALSSMTNSTSSPSPEGRTHHRPWRRLSHQTEVRVRYGAYFASRIALGYETNLRSHQACAHALSFEMTREWAWNDERVGASARLLWSTVRAHCIQSELSVDSHSTTTSTSPPSSSLHLKRQVMEQPVATRRRTAGQSVHTPSSNTTAKTHPFNTLRYFHPQTDDNGGSAKYLCGIISAT